MTFAVQHQVRGFDVSVNDTFTVRSVESASCFLEPRDDALGRLRPGGAEHVVERPAAEVLHDDVGAVVVLADVEDRDDIGLAGKTGCRERLARETLAAGLVLDVTIGQDLDRHDSAEHRIGGAIDVAHAAAPDRFRGAVARREDGDLHDHSQETTFPPP